MTSHEQRSEADQSLEPSGSGQLPRDSLRLLQESMDERVESMRRHMRRDMIKVGIDEALVDRVLNTFVSKSRRLLAEFLVTMEVGKKFQELDKLCAEQPLPTDRPAPFYRPNGEVADEMQAYEIQEGRRRLAELEAVNKSLLKELHGPHGLIRQVLASRNALVTMLNEADHSGTSAG